MDESEDTVTNDTRLSREVLLPSAPTQGMGVMLVAATAMLFAVTGSALMVRARMGGHSCGQRHQAVSAPNPGAVPTPAITCGVPEYRDNGDGTTAVVFQVCPGDVRTIRIADPDPIDALIVDDVPTPIQGVEIGRVEIE